MSTFSVEPVEVPPDVRDHPYTSADPNAPRTFNEFVGQEEAIQLLRLEVASAKAEGRPLAHTLLYGPPGTGKTVLAYILAHEMGDLPVYSCSGAEWVTQRDTIEALRRISGWKYESAVLLIDELDGANRVAFYPMHQLMTTDHLTYNGTQYGPWRLTVIGTTNRTSGVPRAIRSRFRHKIFVGFYSVEELADIALMNAKRQGFELSPECAQILGENAAGEARKAIHLLHALRLLGPQAGLDPSNVAASMKMAGLRSRGLTKSQQEYLEFLADAGPAGLQTISGFTFVDPADLRDEVEPWLLRSKMVRVDHHGRSLLPAGEAYLQSN